MEKMWMVAGGEPARILHAIRVVLRSESDLSVIVWPADKPSPKHCLRLLNPRRTWWTTQAGDSVELTTDERRTRQTVEAVELYRVHPASENGTVVKSAWHWLNPGKR